MLLCPVASRQIRAPAGEAPGDDASRQKNEYENRNDKIGDGGHPVACANEDSMVSHLRSHLQEERSSDSGAAGAAARCFRPIAAPRLRKLNDRLKREVMRFDRSALRFPLHRPCMNRAWYCSKSAAISSSAPSTTLLMSLLMISVPRFV